MTQECCDDTIQWYAMSAPYRREMAAKRLLDEKGIENFLPMSYRIFTNSSGKKVRKQVPIVSNLLFAHTSRRCLQEVKYGVPYLQYRTRPERGRNVPITVPDKQMQQFIDVCAEHNEQVMFLQPDEINLAKGTPVRVVGGAFDGVEGLFVKVKGVRSRRVVLHIEGIAIAIAEVEPQYIEVISK